MKNIFLTEVFSPRIVPVLQELVEIRATEVLLAVENIFLEGLQLPSGPHWEICFDLL